VIGQCYCQHIDPAEWHEKEQTWEEPRFFYRVPTRLAMHNPLTYNEDVSLAMMEAKSKGYFIKPNALILLKSGLFRGEILIEINRPGDEKDPDCLRLQGNFYTFVSDAPFTRMGEVMDRILRHLKKKGRTVRDFYLRLITCPLCTGDKGYNTVIMTHLK